MHYPPPLENIYKNVWEIHFKCVILQLNKYMKVCN